MYISLFWSNLINLQYWVVLFLFLHDKHAFMFISDKLSTSLSNIFINLQLSMNLRLYFFVSMFPSSSSSVSTFIGNETVLYVWMFSPIQRKFDLDSFAKSFINKWKSYLLPFWTAVGICLCSGYLKLHKECATPLYLPV